MRFWFVAALALIALVGVSYERTVTAATSRDLAQAQAEAALGVSQLLGTWSCAGRDAAGARFAADMTWYHDLAALHFEVLSEQSAARHPRIVERWDASVASGAQAASWQTAPDDDAPPSADFRSDGWHGDRLLWTRAVPGATRRRVFERLRAGRLRFAELDGPAQGAFVLDCRRIDAGDSLSA